MFGEPITYGGQESVVFNMLSSLNLRKDFIVDLYTPYYADNQKLIDLVESNNGKVYYDNIEFRLNDNRLRLKKYVDSFFKNNNKYDVVHIHTGSLTTMYVYAKLAKKYRIRKVIVHSHTTGFKIGFIFKFRRYILNMLLKKYVDVYLACSENAIKFKFANYYSSNPIIVYNGIDVDKFKFQKIYRDEIRGKYNINDEFIIGSLGRLSFEKNSIFMLNILKKLIDNNKNVLLLIAGDGDYYEPLNKRCKELNLEKYVIFTGKVLDSYKYYSAFDLFILPSFYEGMPVTAIEAQMSGLNCLISNTVTKECCISPLTKFLPISNIDLWVDEIIQTIDSNNKNSNNRSNLNIDYDKFDRNKTFKIIEKIYNE